MKILEVLAAIGLFTVIKATYEIAARHSQKSDKN